MRLPDDELRELAEQSLLRKLPTLAEDNDTSMSVICFASNDYLGLSRHPKLLESAEKALRKHGAGATASRLICGGSTAHDLLEQQIAAAKNTPACITFANGYTTSVGSLTALMQKGDTIILDKLCHASLIDGARMSGATLRVFPHNHLEKLEHLLKTNRAEKNTRTLVVTESIFSMDGDTAPLAEIVQLCQKYGALLMVDEAHALGIRGETGMGLAEELGLTEQIDFHLGTLGKAAGAAGGYIAASRPWIDLIINRARSLIYSTAPPPSQVAAAAAAIKLIRSEEGSRLRDKLWSNIHLLDKKASSAIIPHIVGENESALALSAQLRELGYRIPAIRFPTVPRGTARLRITLSSAHQPSDVKKLRAALDASSAIS